MPVLVPRLDQPPHRCAFTLRDQDPEGFFVGETLSGWDPTAAVSVSYARTLARELGYVHPDNHRLVLDELETAREHTAALEEHLGELQAKFDAIDVLASAGFQARKRAGRPPSKERQAA